MNKKQITSKILAVRVPTPIFDKFKQKCDEESFRMSEVIRLYIRDFSENGPSGALYAYKNYNKGE
jgi:hypothetical protein